MKDPAQSAWMVKQSPSENVVKGRAYPATSLGATIDQVCVSTDGAFEFFNLNRLTGTSELDWAMGDYDDPLG